MPSPCVLTTETQQWLLLELVRMSGVACTSCERCVRRYEAPFIALDNPQPSTRHQTQEATAPSEEIDSAQFLGKERHCDHSTPKQDCQPQQLSGRKFCKQPMSTRVRRRRSTQRQAYTAVGAGERYNEKAEEGGHTALAREEMKSTQRWHRGRRQGMPRHATPQVGARCSNRQNCECNT